MFMEGFWGKVLSCEHFGSKLVSWKCVMVLHHWCIHSDDQSY